jgi:hypothetical protein
MVYFFRAERGAEGPGFLNPKSSDKKINFPEPGTPERPRSKPGPSPAFCVCRARHMFLKVSQMYRIPIHLASLRPSLMEAKGVVVWQRGIGDGTSEGSRPAEAGHHKSTG